MDDKTVARIECERWLDTHPGWQVAFHDVCMWCSCDCKGIYLLHGVTGQHGCCTGWTTCARSSGYSTQEIH